MSILQHLNLGLRFLLELCALWALGYWGFQTGKGNMMKMFLGIGAPLITAITWGVFGSPKAIFKLTIPWNLFLEILLFGLPAVALYFAGKPQLAWIFVLFVIINRLFMFVWKQ